MGFYRWFVKKFLYPKWIQEAKEHESRVYDMRARELLKTMSFEEGFKLYEKEKVIPDNQTTTCIRSCTAVKNTREQIDKQWEEMQMRAMKAHESTCEDPMMCEKEVCFIREPDKIVKRYYK